MSKPKPKTPNPDHLRCIFCSGLVARRLKSGVLAPFNNSQVEPGGVRRAPRVKCGRCGKVMVLLAASR